MEILSSKTILRPADYERTLAFYRDTLGLAIFREYPGGTVLFAGQGLLEIAGHMTPGDFGGVLYFQVRDVAAVQSELTAAGVEITRAAQREMWGLTEMWLTDPDGVSIIVAEVPPGHPQRGGKPDKTDIRLNAK